MKLARAHAHACLHHRSTRSPAQRATQTTCAGGAAGGTARTGQGAQGGGRSASPGGGRVCKGDSRPCFKQPNVKMKRLIANASTSNVKSPGSANSARPLLGKLPPRSVSMSPRKPLPNCYDPKRSTLWKLSGKRPPQNWRTTQEELKQLLGQRGEVKQHSAYAGRGSFAGGSNPRSGRWSSSS